MDQPFIAKTISKILILEIFTHSKQLLRKFSFKTEAEKVKKLLGKERNWLIKRKVNNNSKNKKKLYLLLIHKLKLFLQNMVDTLNLLQWARKKEKYLNNFYLCLKLVMREKQINSKQWLLKDNLPNQILFTVRKKLILSTFGKRTFQFNLCKKN